MAKLLKALAVLAAVVLSAGCATSSQMVGPNGEPVHAIKCGAAIPEACLQKAGELCPRGYNVVQSSGSVVVGQVNTASVTSTPYQASGYGISTPVRSQNLLVVGCRS